MYHVCTSKISVKFLDAISLGMLSFIAVNGSNALIGWQMDEIIST